MFRLLRLPVALPPEREGPRPGKQPLQDANGCQDPPQLLPVPSMPSSRQSLHSNAPALRSKEPANITVGTIANAYFGSAPPGGAMSTWAGQSQLSPAPEASHAAAAQALGSGSLHSHPPASLASEYGHPLPHRSGVVPLASTYMARVPWEADSAPAPAMQLPHQQQQVSAKDWLEPRSLCGSGSDSGVSPALLTRLESHNRAGDVPAREPPSPLSRSSSKLAKSVLNDQQAVRNAESGGRSPRAAASSAAEGGLGRGGGSVTARAGASRGEHRREKKGGGRPAVTSPPRYHPLR